MVVPDPALEPRGAAGRREAAGETGRGERVQGLVNGLQGDVTQTGPHLGGDGLNAEVVALADGLEQGHAGRRHLQPGAAYRAGGRRILRGGHGGKIYAYKQKSFKRTN